MRGKPANAIQTLYADMRNAHGHQEYSGPSAAGVVARHRTPRSIKILHPEWLGVTSRTGPSPQQEAPAAVAIIKARD
jgi:hypothetical protein